MARHPVLDERAALCDIFEEVGPDAPTWCGEWTTHDLAAHLWAREHRLDAGPGLVVGGPLATHTERVRRRTARRPYRELVAELRGGPPWQWPGRWLPDADVHEWFVHHEDVRRPAGREPRDDVGRLDGALWKSLGRMGKQLTKDLGVGVRLETPDGRTRVLHDGASTVVLGGSPGSLMLRLFGRPVDVEIGGDHAAVDRFVSASLGI